jgi:MFS family permease
VRGTFGSLAIRNYRLYFTGLAVSAAGTWMQNIAVGWLTLQSFHSGTILGAVTAVRYAPIVVAGLWSGLIVDRLNTRWLLVATESAQASLALLLGLVALDGHVRLPVIFAIVAGIGIVDVLDVPARQSIVSEIVHGEQLGNAIGLTAIATNVARAVGPAIAGGLIAAAGTATCFFINAGSFAAFIVALVAMRASEIDSAREVRAAGQVRAGLRYIRTSPPLVAGLVMVAVTGTLTWEYPVSLPILTTSTFHGDATAYGFAISSIGLGAVIGAVVAARRSLVTVRSLAGYAVVWGVVMIVAAAAPALVALYALLVVVGVCGITFNSAARVLLQSESVPMMRGRVMSLWFMGWQGSTLLGAPLVGIVGKEIGGRYALAIGGAGALLVGAIFRRSSSASVAVAIRPEPAD